MLLHENFYGSPSVTDEMHSARIQIDQSDSNNDSKQITPMKVFDSGSRGNSATDEY